MNSYKYCLKEACDFLEGLNINEHTNALWDVLHRARWHKGIDWVRWMDENKPLVYKLIVHDYISKCSEELQREVWDSIKKLKKLDR